VRLSRAPSAAICRVDYTAVGQTTHLAARMKQLASPGTMRLTADTLRLGAGTRRWHLSAAAARAHAVVRREAEVAQLHQATPSTTVSRALLP